MKTRRLFCRSTPLFWNQKSDCSCWSIWTVLTSPRYPAPKRIKKGTGVRLLQKLPAIHRKVSALHQFIFDTLREKCSVSYLKREEATKDSDIPADLQFSHLDTRDDYYLAPRHLHCILTNLRTAADPASSLRKKFVPAQGAPHLRKELFPEPA